MMRSALISLFSLCAPFLWAAATAIVLDLPPPTMSGNVDLTTGELFLVETDLVVRSAEPFAIMRTHASGESEDAEFGIWHLAEDRLLLFFSYSTTKKLQKERERRKYYEETISLREQSGRLTRFSIPSSWGMFFKYKGDATLEPEGIEPLSLGPMNGRSNWKNSRLLYNHPGQFELIKGSGERSYYCGTHHINGYPTGSRLVHTADYYSLKERSLPNGNRILYSYDTAGRPLEIRAINAAGNILGWAKFSYREWPAERVTRIETSDGQWAEYRYTNVIDIHDDLGERLAARLTSVRTSLGKAETYLYNAPQFGLSNIVSKEGGQCALEYLEIEGQRRVAREQRAKRAPFLCSRYEYWEERDAKGDPLHFVTRVQNDYGATTEYKSSSATHQLSEIIHYFNYGAWDRPHSVREQFTWASGNLLIKRIIDADGKVVATRELAYDGAGNVLKETLRGSLTGGGSDTQLESHSHTYSYSQDGRNLVLQESDGETTTTYAYQGGSDLCTLKLQQGSEGALRQLFLYDESAALIREVRDDGSSINPDDLSDVTERSILRITNRKDEPGIGLPETIEERYWDRTSGEEPLLRKSWLHYDERNLVISKDIFDSHNQHRLTLNTRYDKAGRVVEESSSEGPLPDGFSRKFWRCPRSQMDALEKNEPERTIRLATSSDPHGVVTTYSYDFLNHPVKEVSEIPQLEGPPLPTLIQREFDLFGNCTKEVDALGTLFERTYNARGQLLSHTYPDGTRDEYLYSLSGRLLKKKLRDGITLRTARDAFNRVVLEETLSPVGEIIKKESFEYRGERLISRCDGMGVTTQYSYNGAGLLVEERSTNHHKSFEWDALGRKIKQITWCHEERNASEVYIWCYDVLDRVIEERIENLEGEIFKRVEYGYDRGGQACYVVTYDAAGGRVEERSEFDALGRLVSKVDGLGNVTLITYEEGPIPRSTCIEPCGSKREIRYDCKGRPLLIERRDSAGEPLSRLETIYNQRGSKIEERETLFTKGSAPSIETRKYAYDNLGRLIRQKVTSASLPPQVTHFTYNTLSLIETMTRPCGETINYSYDALGRQIKEGGEGWSHSTSYDLCDRWIQVIDADGVATKRGFGAMGELLFEQLGNGLLLTFSYDSCGRLSHLDLPDGSSLLYSYTAAALKSIARLGASGSLLYSHTDLESDTRGLPLRMRLPGMGGELAYSWDALCRCLSIHHKGYSPIHPSVYAEEVLLGRFDSTGAPIALSIRDRVGSYTKPMPQETSPKKRPLDDPDPSLRFDKKGRLAQLVHGNETMRYLYDPEGRLAAIEGSQLALRFTYDALNRRLSKEILVKEEGGKWKPKSHLRFLYYGTREIGAVNSAGKLVEFRAPRPEPLPIGAIAHDIAIELDGELYIPLHDREGSVVALLNSSGRLVESYRYTPKGECLIFGPGAKPYQRSLIGNPYRFHGMRLDEESSLLIDGSNYYKREGQGACTKRAHRDYS